MVGTLIVHREAARLAGIDAEQFTGYETLLNHLRARGIAI